MGLDYHVDHALQAAREARFEVHFTAEEVA
jgi:hypothetical protein